MREKPWFRSRARFPRFFRRVRSFATTRCGVAWSVDPDRSTDRLDVTRQTTHPSKRRKRRFVNRDLEIHATPLSRNELFFDTDRASGHRPRVTPRRNGRNANDLARETSRSSTNFSPRTPRPCFSRTNKRQRCARAPNAPRHRARRRARRRAARSGSTLTASITRARADAGKKATTRSSSRTPTIDRCTRSIAVIRTAMRMTRISRERPNVSQRIARRCKKV